MKSLLAAGPRAKPGGGVAQALIQMENQWAQASKTGNADALAPPLSEDFIALDSGGSLRGKAVDAKEPWADTWVKSANGKWQCVASASAPMKYSLGPAGRSRRPPVQPAARI